MQWQMGLKQETGLGSGGPRSLRKSELLPKGSGEPLKVLEEGSDAMKQLATEHEIVRLNKGRQMPIDT